LANQKRIRSFNWITPQHLDAAINPDSDKVQQLIEDAQQGNVGTLPVCYSRTNNVGRAGFMCAPTEALKLKMLACNSTFCGAQVLCC